MPTYQDGPFPSGSPILVNGLGTTYKCNSFSTTPSAETVQIVDENGAQAGALQFPSVITFNAEVQFANNAVAEPVPAAMNNQLGVFINVNIMGANRNCFVTDAVTSKPQRGPWTCQITGQVRTN